MVFPDKNWREIEFISKEGKKLASVDLSTLPNMNFLDGLFPENVFYVGTLVSPHAFLSINHLVLGYAADGIYRERPVGMRELADQRNFLIGTDLASLYNGNLQTYSILENEFNGATIDFSWDQIEPEKGKFDFSITDPQVQFAIDHKMKITGLHLLWGERGHLPEWLVNGNFSKDELKGILREYIFSLATHYEGKIFIWSIANEYTDRVIWGGDFWRDKLGPEYVKLAFGWAREADPNAILMLNEDGNDSMANWHAQVTSLMLSYVKNWKLEGVPIDAIGMQMHFGQVINNPVPTTDQVVETMNQFSNLGLPVYITEFDLNLQNVPGSEAERARYQADGYQRMFTACLEADACKGFSVYGISDTSSWLNSTYPNAQPLLFDKNNEPKPAYYALINELKQLKTTPQP